MADSLDLSNRDPNNLNDHIKVTFEDVLGEPEGAHSIDCVWKLAYTCFNCWLGLCYKIATILCGICIAAEWGCAFAEIAFYHVWFITPSLKYCELNCAVCTKVVRVCVSCCCEPCCEALGGIFHHFGKK
ncbi:CAV1-like protein [Mya arenaria]|uniref:Caveolin n=1 Tax=Mya arenaria TaxID=6604 RepID=A0ABY7F0Q9_MYAAR|nr:caveolin-1-like [Mya arenaria]WAR14799.1 CAV1-like protein [Mya arenaria]